MEIKIPVIGTGETLGGGNGRQNLNREGEGINNHWSVKGKKRGEGMKNAEVLYY